MWGQTVKAAVMLRRLYTWLNEKERQYRNSFGDNITDPVERARSYRHYNWIDHGILRHRWRNFAEVAPGVYRSNHPHHERFVDYAGMGIKSVLNLRGAIKQSFYLFEQESCAQLGLELVTVHMGARHAPNKHTLIDLLDTFETLPKPFMMHCKSGADRTGLASAFYLLEYTDATDAEVRAQLSFTYLHIRKSSTGILDHVLEAYLTARDEAGIALRTWIETQYDKEAMTASYAAKKANERFWQGW